MRPQTWWGRWIGVVSLCSLVTLLHTLGAEESSPERLVMDVLCQAMPWHCPQGVAQTTLWAYDWHTLQPAAGVPPEDPIARVCRYVGFQTEWVASKRDAGLALGKALTASRRVFVFDMPWHDAIVSAMATLVYRAPQRSPAELRQAMEAACLGHPLLWMDHPSDW
jgi:hypothetical protein